MDSEDKSAIYYARVAKGMSQGDLIRAMFFQGRYVSQNQMSLWETKNRYPEGENALALSKILGIPQEEIVNPKKVGVLSNKIYRMRQSRGFTQKKLSEKSGVAQITICQYEQGRGSSVKVYRKLADAIGCKLADILPDNLQDKS